MLTRLTFRTHWLGNVVKGQPDTLVEEGLFRWEAMRKHGITESDLQEAMRLKLSSEDLAQVQRAVLERNGNSIFIKKEREAQVIAVSVERGDHPHSPKVRLAVVSRLPGRPPLAD